jgi:hypothetical protein
MSEVRLMGFSVFVRAIEVDKIIFFLDLAKFWFRIRHSFGPKFPLISSFVSRKGRCRGEKKDIAMGFRRRQHDHDAVRAAGDERLR